MLDKFYEEGLLDKIYTLDNSTTDMDCLRPQRLYFLRRVHKTPHQLRPIVSCCSGPTQKLSKLANRLLAEYLEYIPSLVNNSSQVINCVEELQIPAEARKHHLGYTGCEESLSIHPTSRCNPFKNMLREMLMLVLKENTFIFAGEHYRQITGIAMGTPVAPTLANLFMGKVEHEALSAWGGTQPLVWLRYIDDILVIMEDSQEKLLELVKHLNARISTIKYTAEISDKSIDFLDLTIFKDPRYQQEGVLDIQPYSKAIDPHSYLHYSSAHHPFIKSGVVRAEFIRTLRKIIVTNHLQQGSKGTFFPCFENRGYPKDLLKEISFKINFKDRQQQLEFKGNKKLEDCTTILKVKHLPFIQTQDLQT